MSAVCDRTKGMTQCHVLYSNRQPAIRAPMCKGRGLPLNTLGRVPGKLTNGQKWELGREAVMKELEGIF